MQVDNSCQHAVAAQAGAAVGEKVRVSSYCTSAGCVEVAFLADGTVAVRHSRVRLLRSTPPRSGVTSSRALRMASSTASGHRRWLRQDSRLRLASSGPRGGLRCGICRWTRVSGVVKSLLRGQSLQVVTPCRLSPGRSHLCVGPPGVTRGTINVAARSQPPRAELHSWY